MQQNKDVYHQGMNMYCVTNQFPEFHFLGPHNKPRGIRGLCKYEHMSFDPKVGHDTCGIRSIPCACPPCTSMLGQPLDTGIPE